ncbi:chitinase, partial [Streptomyces sp. Tu 4128]
MQHRKLALLAATGAAAALCSLTLAPSALAQKSDAPGSDARAAAEFVVSEAQFNQMFPNRNSFYTYSGLTAALSAYPGFTNTGSDTVKKQEAAAFLANVSHETGGLQYVVEQNEAN